MTDRTPDFKILVSLSTETLSSIFFWEFFSFVAQQPMVNQGLLIIEDSRSHQTHHTRKVSSGRVINQMQRPPPDNTQYSQETDIPTGGIRTHNPSKRADLDPRYRPRGTGIGCLGILRHEYVRLHVVTQSGCPHDRLIFDMRLAEDLTVRKEVHDWFS
jgi:hypothetical protein